MPLKLELMQQTIGVSLLFQARGIIYGLVLMTLTEQQCGQNSRYAIMDVRVESSRALTDAAYLSVNASYASVGVAQAQGVMVRII